MRLFAHRSLITLLATAAFVLTGCGQDSAEPAAATNNTTATAEPIEVTVYTSRKEHLIKPLFDRFTAETGTNVRYITDAEGPLMARLQAEGETTPADILMTVDAGNLWQASQMGLLQPLTSTVLDANIPANLQAANKEWYGLSIRARTIVYDTDRVKPEELSTYENLADPKWQGRLCLRTSKKVYNQSLVATMIKSLGETTTESIVKGWVANLATAPFSSDTMAMDAMVAGQCDVSIVNTYYFARMIKDKPDLPLALFWPNQQDRGVHINISGAGLTKHAKHPQQAQALLEFLSTPEAQGIFAELNQEYPANPAVKPSAEVAAWGEFKADSINVEAAGSLQVEAVKLMDRAGYR